jgi:fumarate hydratase class II
LVATALNPHIAYEEAAKISLSTYREAISVRQATLKLGFLTEPLFVERMRPEETTHALAG